MSERKTSVIIGGSSGIGFAVAQALAARGGERIVLTSRDAGRAEAAARKIGGDAVGLAFDLAEPHTIAAKLAGVGAVDHLAILRRRARPQQRQGLRRRPGDPPGDDQAGRLCRGDPRAAAAPDGERVGRAVRRPGARAALSRLDHRHRGQRRGDDDGAQSRLRAAADPLQRDSSWRRRRQPGLGRQHCSPRSDARPDARRADWRRPPIASPRRCSCSTTRA